MVRFLLLVTSLIILSFSSGCNTSSSSNTGIISKELTYVESEQHIVVLAEQGLAQYQWTQIAGPEIKLNNAQTHKLEFTASLVEEETTLIFELTAIKKSVFGDKTLKDQITIKVTPIETINAHRLPPEPDPQENNATLAGIDSNNNGVRDDVERWIYHEYKDKHPVYIDVAMQQARAWQKIMTSHVSDAKQTTKFMENATSCEAYYKTYADEFNEPLLIRDDIQLKWLFLKLETRKKKYIAYDKALSGGVYTVPWSWELKSKCDFDTSKYEQ